MPRQYQPPRAKQVPIWAICLGIYITSGAVMLAVAATIYWLFTA